MHSSTNSYKVSFEGAGRVCAPFFFNTIYVVRYLFSSRVFYTSKDLEHLETDF